MSDRVKVAAIQAEPGQVDGPPGDLDRLEQQTAEAAGQGAKLVVWPECAYPAYFLRSAEHYRQTASSRLNYAQVLDRVGRIAGDLRVHLVAGIVEERDDGNLSNAAALFGPTGKKLAIYRKVFLWHFDQRYFIAGDASPVVETEIGRIGMMICADGRCPELAAMAGRQNAQIICNPTAWVSWGRRVETLTNPQIEYFIPARAIENGCWVLSANKAGVEADSIVYCGRSNLIDPSGQLVASLDSAQPGVLVAEVDLSAAGRTTKSHTDQRLTHCPPIIFQDTATLPVTRTRLLARQQGPRPTHASDALVLAAVAGKLSDFDPGRLLADLAAQSVDCVIASGSSDDPSADRLWMQTANRFGMMLCLADRSLPGHGVTRLRLAGGPVETFAAARAAMLNDCQVFIASPRADGSCADIRLLRARAGENRVFVVAAAVDRACVISPVGAVLADSLAGRAMAVVVRFNPDDVNDKQMAPGTDVVASRNPDLYAKYLGPAAESIGS